jgi:HSPB1-associated protein 1
MLKLHTRPFIKIYGYKEWFLVSPDKKSSEKLKPTRIPYEESSIYSGIHKIEELNLQDKYKVVLEPGDVLYVPNKWFDFT